MVRGRPFVYAIWLLPLLIAVFAAYRVIHRLHYDEAIFNRYHHYENAWRHAHEEQNSQAGEPYRGGVGARGIRDRAVDGLALEEEGERGHDDHPSVGGTGEEEFPHDGDGDEAEDEGEWQAQAGGGLLASKEYVGKEVHSKAKSKPKQQQLGKSSGQGGSSPEQRIRSQVDSIFQQVAANQARADEMRRRGVAASQQQSAFVRSTMEKVQRKNDKAHAASLPPRIPPRGGDGGRGGRRSKDDEDKRAKERKEHERKEREDAAKAKERQAKKDREEREREAEVGQQHEDPAPAEERGAVQPYEEPEGAEHDDGEDGSGSDHQEEEPQEEAATPSPRPRSGSCPLAPEVWDPLGSATGDRRALLGAAAGGADRRAATLGAAAADSNRTSPAHRRLSSFSEAAQGHKSYGVSCEKGSPLKARQACYEQRMLKRCEGEKRRKQLQEGEEELAGCIRDMKSCTTSKRKLVALARGLKGIQMLMGAGPKCMVYNIKVPCDSVHANDETALTMGCGERGGGPKEGCDKRMMTGFAQNYIRMPTRDLRRKHFKTCAVVGNSMNLFRTANGHSIDAHDMVMRFNNEVARMEHVLSLDKDGGPLAHHKIAHYIGHKTAIRLLNRKYTVQMLEGEADPNRLLAPSKIKVHFPKEERLIFWNYFSAPYIKALQTKYWWNQILLMAPEMVNWQLEAFSQLRKDLYRLGLAGNKGFGCYRSMSSGVHGLFLAFQLCDRVDMYGFSVSMDNFKKGFNHGRPSESHSWEFETMLMRLIYYAGLIDVCNH